jgi:hypothetical protein
MRKLFSLHRCLLSAIVLIAVCVPCWAQGNLRTVLFVKVKQDHEDSWKASVRDYVALVKKAGSEQPFSVWQSQTGPSEYAVVWYSAKWKEMDQDNPKLKPVAADLANLFARLNTETMSLETWIDEAQPDLMLRSQQIPTMVRTGRTRVVSGKMDDVKAVFHDQIIPAVKKAGVTDFGVFVARYGTPSNEIHTYVGLSSWSELDSPFGAEKGMGPADYKAFQAKIAPMIEGTEWTIWKFQSDLSYTIAK